MGSDESGGISSDLEYRGGLHFSASGTVMKSCLLHSLYS